MRIVLPGVLVLVKRVEGLNAVLNGGRYGESGKSIVVMLAQDL